MFADNGISIFMLFSDTTAKLADFAPQRTLDPSARMLPDKTPRDVAGQQHAPFTDLSTAAGLMLAPKGVFDFRQRLEAFCNKWGKPALDSNMECVSEQITLLSFDVLNETPEISRSNVLGHHGPAGELGALNADADTGISSGCYESAGRNNQDEAIFRSNEDYLFLGRPLWASAVVHNQKRASWQHVIIFALEKLLGGRQHLSDDPSIYAKQCLAVLACRVPLQSMEYCEIAPQLIAEHMAWCAAVSWDRESVYLTYLNEPLVATAAAVLWDRELESLLRCLVAGCGSYVSNKGDLGEVAACIWLTVAVDNAYKNKADKTAKQDVLGDALRVMSDRRMQEIQEDTPSPAKKEYDAMLKKLPKGLSMHSVVTLQDMLEGGFPVAVEVDYCKGSVNDIKRRGEAEVEGHAWVSKRNASSGQDSVVFVPPLLAHADVRFKSIKRASGSVGCGDIPFLFEANVAVLVQRQQKGVDLLIPLRLHMRTDDGRSETGWSCVTVLVKNRQSSPRAPSVAGQHLDPISTQAVHCDVRDNGLCSRCLCVKHNHFGVVLNVSNGIVAANERDYGPVWTFLSSDSEAIQNDAESDQDVPRTRKKRKLNEEQDAGNENRDIGIVPTTATLIVNGLRGSCRSRLQPEIMRQIENLVAQDNLSGIIRRRTEQYNDSVDKVLEAASNHDRNYRKLVETAALSRKLAVQVTQSYERKY